MKAVVIKHETERQKKSRKRKVAKERLRVAYEELKSFELRKGRTPTVKTMVMEILRATSAANQIKPHDYFGSVEHIVASAVALRLAGIEYEKDFEPYSFIGAMIYAFGCAATMFKSYSDLIPLIDEPDQLWGGDHAHEWIRLLEIEKEKELVRRK